MTIRDFVKHIKIMVQAKGYGSFQNNNIQLDVIFLGKTMHHISNHFKVQITDIIKTLSSKGIKFLKPSDFNSETLVDLEWAIKLDEPEQTLQPTDSILYRNRNGNLNVRFSGYQPSTS